MDLKAMLFASPTTPVARALAASPLRQAAAPTHRNAPPSLCNQAAAREQDRLNPAADSHRLPLVPAALRLLRDLDPEISVS